MNAPLRTETAALQGFDQAIDTDAGALTTVGQAVSVQDTALAANDPRNLLSIAIQRGMPVETIDRLMTMAERFEALQERERLRRAESAYIRALADLKSEVVTVLKTKRVNFESRRTQTTTDYKHAELSDVMEAIGPVAARVGLTWNYPVIEQTAQWIRVTCRIRHVDGFFEDLAFGGPPDDSGNKNTHQSNKSAVTYLMRLTLEALLGIAEKGTDDDSRGTGNRREGLPAASTPAADGAEAAPARSVASMFAECNTVQELSRAMNGLSMAEKKQHQGAFNARREALKGAAQ